MERIGTVEHEGVGVVLAVAKSAGRTFRTFSDRRSALDRLVEQP